MSCFFANVLASATLSADAAKGMLDVLEVLGTAGILSKGCACMSAESLLSMTLLGLHDLGSDACWLSAPRPGVGLDILARDELLCTELGAGAVLAASGEQGCLAEHDLSLLLARLSGGLLAEPTDRDMCLDKLRARLDAAAPPTSRRTVHANLRQRISKSIDIVADLTSGGHKSKKAGCTSDTC
mmetsp:Transcript_42935/g.98571  ORF Transcript_42935/g.98571 Transcript_42935/m.98571 type:complete len:184 (+) Transcript_42935:470-1021(+)